MERMTLALLALVTVSLHSQQSAQNPEPGFRFKAGVELINVTASVFDASGRFVPDLQQEDFIVYEDDQPQPVSHFTAERVPVSLGIALDTSGSMAGERMRAAKSALDRFLYDLLDAEDEILRQVCDLRNGWARM
jgi:VWFA-related protein